MYRIKLPQSIQLSQDFQNPQFVQISQTPRFVQNPQNDYSDSLKLFYQSQFGDLDTNPLTQNYYDNGSLNKDCGYQQNNYNNIYV